jgi:hypothetical protein
MVYNRVDFVRVDGTDTCGLPIQVGADWMSVQTAKRLRKKLKEAIEYVEAKNGDVQG